MSGDGDGIAQNIPSLLPNQEYVVSAWVRTRNGAIVALEVPEFSVRTNSVHNDHWQMLQARFTTGAESVPCTIVFTKTGGGEAFVDDVGLVGVIEGLEPVHPGFPPR